MVSLLFIYPFPFRFFFFILLNNMVWRSKYTIRSHRSGRMNAGGTIDLKKVYATDGAIGNLRYKATARKYKPHQHKTVVPLQESELTIPTSQRKPEPAQTPSGRKRVLEELGEMLSGKRSRDH